MSMRILDYLGPVAHARATLADEPVLWAAFSSGHHFDVRGVGVDGKPRRGLGVRAATGLLDAMGEGPDQASNVPADVVVFGDGQCEALRLTQDRLPHEGGPFVWALTPLRMHVAELLTPEKPEHQGFLKTWFPTSTGVPALLRETRPLVDIPASAISGFQPADRKGRAGLRMTLVDGSGVDLFFRATRLGQDTDPDQYARLLALSQGRADQWT
ncbi:hypothetical protein ACTG9Q_00775 [Actinokineospora sp. 24-640]